MIENKSYRCAFHSVPAQIARFVASLSVCNCGTDTRTGIQNPAKDGAHRRRHAVVAVQVALTLGTREVGWRRVG